MAKTKSWKRNRDERKERAESDDFVDIRKLYKIIDNNKNIIRDWVDSYLIGTICDVVGIKHIEQEGETFMAEIPVFDGWGDMMKLIPLKEFNELKDLLIKIENGEVKPKGALMVLDEKYDNKN